ncbi:MAG: CBS domain-containing protein [Persicimonas sp.]
MMKVIEICTTDVVTATEDETLFRAAWLMREHHVGDVVVTREKEDRVMPVGILTDRDFVTAMVAEGEDDFAETTVGDAMTKVLIVARDDDDLDEVLNNMESNGVRRVPVIDRNDSLVGVISYDDIVTALADRLHKLARITSAEIKREQQERP